MAWLAAAVGAWLSLAGVSAAQTLVERPPEDPSVIRWDPAIRHGVLANGLRYAVMRNAMPSGGVSIRLGIGAGSLNDPDDALGAAHFLEHMAFGGSHAQLQVDVEKAFADAGVAFGRDRNAETRFTDTTYRIDLPHGDDAALDLGFRWLRAVADGARLTPESIDRERGVIQAERESRLSALAEASERATAFQARGTLLARGSAVGSRESIAAISAAALQTFYDRWYRPDNAAVVVVGDEPLDKLEARVRDTFGSWRSNAEPLGPSPRSSLDEKRGLDVMTLQEPQLPDVVSVCRAAPADPDRPHDIQRMRRDLARAIWALIANARLASSSADPAAGLVSANAIQSVVRGQPVFSCFVAVPIQGKWPQALSELQRQSQRLENTDPQDDEVEAAIKTLRSRLRGPLFGKSARESSDLADQALSALLDNDASASPSEALRAFDVAVESLTPTDVRNAYRRDWAAAGPLIGVTAASPPSADAVRQAWAGPSSRTAEAGADKPPPAWAYQSFGRAGKVATREVFKDADFVRLTFANGVRLNFKHLGSGSDQVAVRVRFGAGRREIDPKDFMATLLGAGLFERGGLGRTSYKDLKASFAEYDFKVELRVGDSGFVLASGGAPSGLTTDMQVLTAYLTDPGFRDLDSMLPTVWQAALRTVRGYPSAMLGQALIDGVAPGNPAGMAAMAAAPAPTSADFIRALRPALSEAPLEVTIVGDIDEKAAIEATASTLGALPTRKARPRERADAWFLRFPDHAPPVIAGHHNGSAEQAAVAQVWPLYVAEPARRHEEYALQLLSLTFKEALLRRIRGDLGKTYAPEALTSMPDHGDQGYLIAEVETSASDLDQVRSEMTALAAKMARGEFTDDDVETVRKPLLQRIAKAATDSDTWADVLESSSTDLTALNDFQHAAADIASVTPADVRKAAADWMTKTPITVLVTAEPASKATAAAQ